MHNAIVEFLRTSYTCLLFVHPKIGRLEAAANELSSAYGWPHLSLGRELSAELLSERPQLRSRAAGRWVWTRLAEVAPGPVLCTEVDLLFEPSLALDPLWLMRSASRVTRLVVTWPGSYVDDVLSYAAPAHSHYRIWRRPDVLIRALD